MAKKNDENKNVCVNVDAKLTKNYKKTFNESNKILNNFQKNTQNIFNATNAILNKLPSNMSNVTKTLKPIVGILEKSFITMPKVANYAFTKIQTSMNSTFKRLESFPSIVNKSINKTNTSFKILKLNFKNLNKIINETAKNISPYIKDIGKEIFIMGKTLFKPFEKITNPLFNAFEKITNPLSNTLKILKKEFNNFKIPFGDKFSKLMTNSNIKLKLLFKKMGNNFGSVIDNLKIPISNLESQFINLFNKAKIPLLNFKKTFLNINNKIENNFKNIFKNINNPLQNLDNSLHSSIKNIQNSFQGIGSELSKSKEKYKNTKLENKKTFAIKDIDKIHYNIKDNKDYETANKSYDMPNINTNFANIMSNYSEYGKYNKSNLSIKPRKKTKAPIKINKAEQAIMKNSLASVGTAATMGVMATTLPGLVIDGAIMSGQVIKSGIDAYEQFEDESSKFRVANNLSKDSKEFQKIESIPRKLSKKSTKNNVEIMSTINSLYDSGWSINDIESGIEPVVKLQEATNMDGDYLSTLLSGAMNSANIPKSQLSTFIDQLIATENNSSQSLEDLLEGYKSFGGISKTLGIDTVDTSTMLGIMGNQGINGSDSAKILKTMMLNLTDTKGESVKNLNKLTAKTGLEFFDKNGKFAGLENMFSNLSKALENMPDEEQFKYLSAIGGKENINDLINLLHNVSDEEFNSLKNNIINSKGALDSITEITNSTYSAQKKKFYSSITELRTSIGEFFIPIATKSMNIATKVINYFTFEINCILKLWNFIDSKVSIITDKFSNIKSKVFSTLEKYSQPFLNKDNKNKDNKNINKANSSSDIKAPALNAKPDLFNITQLPSINAYAKGTNFSAKTFIAGEEGAELITNRRGSKIYDALNTRNILESIEILESASSISNSNNDTPIVVNFNPNISFSGNTTKNDITEVLEKTKDNMILEIEKLINNVIIQKERKAKRLRNV